MKKISFYEEAHIFLSAIRIFNFQENGIPTHADISTITGMNIDRVSYIASKLRDEEIIDMVEGAFDKVDWVDME